MRKDQVWISLLLINLSWSSKIDNSDNLRFYYYEKLYYIHAVVYDIQSESLYCQNWTAEERQSQFFVREDESSRVQNEKTLKRSELKSSG